MSYFVCFPYYKHTHIIPILTLAPFYYTNYYQQLNPSIYIHKTAEEELEDEIIEELLGGSAVDGVPVNLQGNDTNESLLEEEIKSIEQGGDVYVEELELEIGDIEDEIAGTCLMCFVWHVNTWADQTMFHIDS